MEQMDKMGDVNPDRMQAVEKLMSDTNAKDGKTGQDEQCLDSTKFPELRGKKEGDSVSLTAKVTRIEGTNVYLEPEGETSDKPKVEPEPLGEPAEKNDGGN